MAAFWRRSGRKANVMRDENVFELLSRLLAEQDIESTELTQLYDELYGFVNTDFSRALDQTEYTAKFRIVAELDDFLAQIGLLLKLPELAGKTVVGLIGTSSPQYFDVIRQLTGGRDALLKFSRNVPTVVYHSQAGEPVRAINILDNTVILEKWEFTATNAEIYKHHIDIRRFINAFAIPLENGWQNIAFVVLPLYALKDKEYYKNLLEMLDAAIIPADEKGKWQEDLRMVRGGRNRLPVYLVENGRDLNHIKMDQDLTISDAAQLVKWIQGFDKPRNNLMFVPRALRICNQVNVQINKKREKRDGLFADINRDLINIRDEETREITHQLKEELLAEKDTADRGFKTYKQAVGQLLVTAAQLEQKFRGRLKNPVFTQYHGDYDGLIAGLCYQLIEAHEFVVCQPYIGILLERGYQKAYLLSLYLHAERGDKVPAAELELLKQDCSGDLQVRRAKVKFRRELGLKAAEYYELVRTCRNRNDLTADEVELLGDSCCSDDLSQAISYYQQALKMGSNSAGKKLLDIPQYQTERNLYFLATALDPEATYLYGVEKLKERKWREGLKYLKISAALGNRKAIRYLADYYSRQSSKNQDDEGFDDAAYNAIALYQYLDSVQEGDDWMYYYLARLYHRQEEYIRALEYFQRSNTAEACYMLGRMYQYGNGVAQDLQEAKKQFCIAMENGHNRAAAEYAKVCKWIQSNQASQTVHNVTDYTPKTTSTYTGSSGGCFITTATCRALGKGDDCRELTAFRAYRDGYLVHDPDGPALIREYYRIAPLIVSKIEARSDSETVYLNLYHDYIAQGYECLKIGELQQAKTTYIKMVLSLCKEFSIRPELTEQP